MRNIFVHSACAQVLESCWKACGRGVQAHTICVQALCEGADKSRAFASSLPSIIRRFYTAFLCEISLVEAGFCTVSTAPTISISK